MVTTISSRLALLVCILSIPLSLRPFDWQEYDTPQNRKYALLTAGGLLLTGTAYAWLKKNAAEQKGTDLEQKVKETQAQINAAEQKGTDLKQKVKETQAQIAELREKHKGQDQLFIYAGRLSELKTMYKVYEDRCTQESPENVPLLIQEEVAREYQHNSTKFTSIGERKRELALFLSELASIETAPETAQNSLLKVQAHALKPQLQNMEKVLTAVEDGVQAHTTLLRVEQCRHEFAAERALEKYLSEPQKLWLELKNHVQRVHGHAKYPYRTYLNLLEKRKGDTGLSLIDSKMNDALEKLTILLNRIEDTLQHSACYTNELTEYWQEYHAAEERNRAQKRHEDLVALKMRALAIEQEKVNVHTQKMRELESKISDLTLKNYGLESENRRLASKIDDLENKLRYQPPAPYYRGVAQESKD